MCYRRADSEEMVDRIYDTLAAAFGEAAVFRDIDAIPPGVDFPTYIQESLRECPVILVFIGKEWANCTDDRGGRRIEDPDDHVRIEVETALSLPGSRVIPIFVKHAQIPGEEELPESLRALRRRNGITVRSSGLDYKNDILHLGKLLQDAVHGVLAARQTGAGERRSPENAACEPETIEQGDMVPAGRRVAKEKTKQSSASPHDASQSDSTLCALAVGQLIAGRFRLEERLGQGGMGVVWRVSDEELKKTRALKFLRDEFADDPTAIAALKAEVGRCQELNHPHIIRLFDLVKDETRGLVAISMEVAEGGSLTSRRLQTPRLWLDPEELLPWVGQLCDALSYIHEEAGLVHRDIKPGNLLLDERGRLKLSDFGISGALADRLSRLTGEQPSTGTPAYMSPEQAAGKAPHPSDDLYSLGATLYELLTGQPPFTGSTVAVRAQLLSDTAPMSIAARRLLLAKFAAPVPQVWEDVAGALLAKKAADRPANAREVMERLRQPGTMKGEAPSSHPMDSMATRLAATAEFPAARRRKTRMLATGIAGLALVAVAGPVIWRSTHLQPPAPGSGGATPHAADEAVVKPANPPNQPDPQPSPPLKPEPVALPAEGQNKLTVTISKTTYHIGDLLELTVVSDRDCFLRVVQFGSDNSTTQLFPNAFAHDNFLRGGEMLRLPNGNYNYRTNPPAGEEKIVVFASSAQFKDNSTLLASTSRGVPFPALQREAVTAMIGQTRGQITVEANGGDHKPPEIVTASVTYQLQ